MADNDNYEDEYQFADPDDVGADSPVQDPEVQAPGDKSVTDKSFASKSRVVRNALIVVALVIIAMTIYPFIHSLFSDEKKTSAITPATQVSTVKKTVITSAPEPVTAPVAVSSPGSQLDNQISQKLSSLESSQDRIQTEFISTNTQLTGINNNVNEMMAKVTALTNAMALYAAKINEQELMIEKLTAQAAAQKKARVSHRVSSKRISPSLQYYIQAVIPGRAWLIATNGATLTVREGTTINGLGTVTLIDPRQGRVLTSSGRIIRFSQQDS